MPIYRSRTAFDIARGIRAFFNLEAGLTRGKVPDPQQQLHYAQTQVREQNLRIKRLLERLAGRERSPEHIRRLPADRRNSAGPDEQHASHEISRLSENTYEELYEAHARAHTSEDAIGDGSFDLIGRLELALLLMEGLKPTDTLVDLGCGTGRLAIHAIPTLAGGRYFGIDISRSMLDEAERRIRTLAPEPKCQVSWLQQTSEVFPLAKNSVDNICAFSVFTHMEHEDTYLYLKDALRIVRPGGRFVFSCLPINLKLAQEVFLEEAKMDLQTRWSKVRNVTTSVETMTEIARLAGWRPVRWYAGDEQNIRLPNTEDSHGLGQSVCVLESPH